jgi:hypothetical protein
MKIIIDENNIIKFKNESIDSQDDLYFSFMVGDIGYEKFFDGVNPNFYNLF